MEPAPTLLFNRALHRLRRDRAAHSFDSVDFLKREAAERLVERLSEITRAFPTALELGAHRGELAACLGGAGGTVRLIQCDLSHAMLLHAEGLRVVCDEERLPFAPSSLEAVLSVLSLHWVNDLPGTLIQIQRILKPDGVFLAVLPGARTLQELRSVLEQAEMELRGGVSPHISPFIEVRDAGNLLMRAGFALPMADSESLSISYSDMFALLADLRGMGEGNALHQRARHLPRSVLMRAAELYHERFADAEGRIVATVELVFLTGWKPDPSQPKPAKRGSGQVAFGEALGGRG